MGTNGDILDNSAGAMPYMDRDLMQWPTAMPSSGSLDLVVQTLVRVS